MQILGGVARRAVVCEDRGRDEVLVTGEPMKGSRARRNRPAVQITLGRAARLYRLVTLMAHEGWPRDRLLKELGIGLRTFYRELELLRRCGVKVRHDRKLYLLVGTAAEAEGRLPFPDPQLSFAEMGELAQGAGPAAKRLAELLASVMEQGAAPAPKVRKSKGGSP